MATKQTQKKVKSEELRVKSESIGAKSSLFFTLRSSLIAIVAITFIAFLPTFRNSYVFWDDPDYILNNPLMTAPLKVVFGIPSGYYLANYHPLTILVYTFEHKFFGSDMMGYHAVSLLLHISNSLLVFFFVYFLLSKKNVMIPFITALLFGIHPMHVESVAWASELKDVLYTFFFLAALVCYVLYMQTKSEELRTKSQQPITHNYKFLALSFLLYLLSLISKGQAVTLPLCFFLVDYFLKRKLDIKMILDKTPFFVLSLAFGILAVKAQNPAAIHNNSDLFQRIFLGFYGLNLYLFKFILPINLSGLYPYPITPDTTTLPFVYMLPQLLSPLF